MDDMQTTTTTDQQSPIGEALQEGVSEMETTITDVFEVMAETGATKQEILVGRYIEHPPEPPHLLQLLYKREQRQLIDEFMQANPGAKKPKAVEAWVEMDAQGNWVPVEGVNPTPLQVLHAGTLTKPLPLIGYAPWENHFYFGISLVFIIATFLVITSPLRSNRKAAMRSPSRLQMAGEMYVKALDDFCKGVLGEENGRKYMPFIATLFTVILINNFMGMIPTMRASTASPIVTFSLAMCTFIVVQLTAWIRLGPLSYVHHLMGQPKDVIGWFLAPLFLILEIISDFFAKPLSLTLRLMGNILGKDILLGAFLGMSIAIMALISTNLSNIVGIPVTIPFYFLGLLLSTIQALVFSLLTMIYITLVLPHDHEHDHHDDHGHHGKPVHEPLPA